MRTLILFIITLIMGVLTINAQSSLTSTSTSTSSSSVTVEDDGSVESESFYRSYVFLDLDNKFKIRLKFMKNRKSLVKSYLIEQFGKENMTIEDDAYSWKSISKEETLYEVKLKKNKVTITFNKEIGSHSESERFKSIGEELKLITGKNKSIN
ncbi:hypothetical protein [uncultured Aquimarina sp.]|uniref:hypothetical protein n=1 Tax=uncultured Aquimarina sp. TaxID=575652 RepID=UPI002615151A|nr:hypothetical protein [uncultured Aquimarina sp.]